MQWMFFLVVIGMSSAGPDVANTYYVGQYKTDKECMKAMPKAAKAVGIDNSWKKSKRAKQGNAFAIDHYSKKHNGNKLNISVQCYATDTHIK